MNRLHVTKLGFAAGSTAAIIYLGCIIVSLFAGSDDIAKLLGYLAHSFDITMIIRKSVVTPGEAVAGMLNGLLFNFELMVMVVLQVKTFSYVFQSNTFCRTG